MAGRASVQLTPENQAAINQFRARSLSVGRKLSESAAINEALGAGLHALGFLASCEVGEWEDRP